MTMKKEASIIISILLLAILLLLVITCSYQSKVHELQRTVENRDSLIEEQRDYILTLTYQHEDDDVLME